MSEEMDSAPAGEVESDVVTAGSALAMHGLLNAPGPAPTSGEPLPPLWHWLAFLPRVPQREIGADGHPKRPSESQPDKYPRRMFVGAKVSFPGVARIGHTLTRRSRVVSTVEKMGQSGPLLFVTFENVIWCEDQVVISELQDIVYRSPSPATPERSDEIPSNTDAQWTWAMDIETSPTMLFRFSALTYNAHRIHYDRRFAQEVEGYPDLVVHGPLQAIALAELCRRYATDRQVVSFRFRAVRPAFEGSPLQLRGRTDGEERVELMALNVAGQCTVTASALLRPDVH